MANLVQKFVVHSVSEASPLLPQHVALVNEDGTEFGGGQSVGSATTAKEGLVKKASATEAVSIADAAAAAGETVTKAEFDSVVALCNALKAALNDHMAKAKSAGQTA